MKLNGLSTSTDGDKNVFGTIPTVSSKSGVTELGKYIDFHATKDSENDYDVRITVADAGEIHFDGINQIANITANLRGTADYANNLIFQKDQVIDTTSLNVNT